MHRLGKLDLKAPASIMGNLGDARSAHGQRWTKELLDADTSVTERFFCEAKPSGTVLDQGTTALMTIYVVKRTK